MKNLDRPHGTETVSFSKWLMVEVRLRHTTDTHTPGTGDKHGTVRWGHKARIFTVAFSRMIPYDGWTGSAFWSLYDDDDGTRNVFETPTRWRSNFIFQVQFWAHLVISKPLCTTFREAMPRHVFMDPGWRVRMRFDKLEVPYAIDRKMKSLVQSFIDSFWFRETISADQ